LNGLTGWLPSCKKVTDIPPGASQLEISVFGPGTGECVLVHIGDGDWIVVDSCIDRRTRRPVALDYLNSLRVDVASRVKLVVATHWHDDHIRGLSDVLLAAESARFVNSAAYDFQQLLRLVALGNRMASPASATREYDRIAELLDHRRHAGLKHEAVGPIPALANKKILALTQGDRSVAAEIIALSPSDAAYYLAKEELGAALSAVQGGRRPVTQGPNQLSIVLWLKVGALDVLLGADMEHVSEPTRGWLAITRSNERPAGRADFFKVPHHGSHNADCSECWTKLLSPDPIAILTPYAPSRLPTQTDIKRICMRSSSAYSTSDYATYGLPRRDNAVERTMRGMAISRRALAGQMGHVRLRCDAVSVDPRPVVQLSAGARQLHV
jgi:hypothetical protein